MIFAIAWRNIWRNKTRSIVVILAIMIGLFGSLFIIALMNGVVEQKIDSAINNEISHVQIHHKKFLQDKSIKHSIESSAEKIDSIRELEMVKSVAARLKTTAMASTAASATGVTINGIDPDIEKNLTRIHTALVDGDYFERKSRTPLILVSKEFADELNAKTGSKVVVTIQDTEGVLTYGLFRVTGIYKTDNKVFDQQNVFVEKKELAELIHASQEKSTEIAVLLHETDNTNIAAEKLRSMFPNLEVLTWKKIQPLLLGLSSMMEQFSIFLLVIILVALAFGIINTMLMVILERTQELGMLMAVGMNKRRVFIMIMLETVFLSLVGTIFGIAISAVVIEITGMNGINFAAWAEGFESLGYSALVYPSLYLSFYILLTGMVLLTAILSSIYPARKALKLDPAEAIREDA